MLSGAEHDDLLLVTRNRRRMTHLSVVVIGSPNDIVCLQRDTLFCRSLMGIRTFEEICCMSFKIRIAYRKLAAHGSRHNAAFDCSILE